MKDDGRVKAVREDLFSDVGDVEAFELHLRGAFPSAVLHISLVDVWHVAERHQEGGRLFTQAFDLQLNVLALQQEGGSIAEAMRDSSQRGVLELRDLGRAGIEERFRLWMEASSFVLRYRAIWDKYMGLIVLLVKPEDYQKYCSNRSRKKFFIKTLTDLGNQWVGLAERVSGTIEAFDAKFRTAEAHGAGVLRRHAFGSPMWTEHPLEDLFWASNSLNVHLIDLAKVLKDIANSYGEVERVTD